MAQAQKLEGKADGLELNFKSGNDMKPLHSFISNFQSLNILNVYDKYKLEVGVFMLNILQTILQMGSRIPFQNKLNATNPQISAI